MPLLRSLDWLRFAFLQITDMSPLMGLRLIVGTLRIFFFSAKRN